MKKLSILFFIFALCFSSVAFAHGGKTDSNGGHRDNHNASGLGSYHYHCDGYPAHLHENGICPYASSNSENMSASERIQKQYEKQNLNSEPEPIYIIKSAPVTEEKEASFIGEYLITGTEWLFLGSFAIAMLSLILSCIFIACGKDNISHIFGKIMTFSFMIGSLMFLIPILGAMGIVAFIFAIPAVIKKLFKKS